MLANKHAKIMLLIVFAILGFMIATQIKTTERQKTINVQRAEELTERFLSASFLTGSRHEGRLNKVKAIENANFK